MVKQITEKSIGHRIRFHIFYSPVRSLFFKIDSMPKHIKSLAQYLDNYKNSIIFPFGVYYIDIISENNIFEISFNEQQITEEEVIKYSKNLGL